MGAIGLILRCLCSSFRIVYTLCSTSARARRPYMCDGASVEYYDGECDMVLPMFVWWDAEHDAGRPIPSDANYAPRGSSGRARYVARSFQHIERSRRMRCVEDIERGAITLTEANDRMNDWYKLRDSLEAEGAVGPRFQECGVCLDEVNSVKCMPCTHELCATCFDKIRSMGGDITCPFCRAPIKDYVYGDALYIV